MDKLISGAEKLGLHFSPDQVSRFEIYYHALIDWNTQVNLTAITDYEDTQVKHFLDSLTIVLAIGSDIVGKNLKVIDVGTGAGFPGIPLKIVFPEIDLNLLEATAKKSKFLEQLVSQLNLKDVVIVNGRAEEIAHQLQFREQFDVVLSRAVASLPALVELALPFCKTGGYFVAQKKGDIAEEMAQAQKVVTVMGGRLRKIMPVEMKEFDDNRCLVIIDKVESTPTRYPRRPGMPEKRPIVS
jgi:16S rRNA (guanine527-N7)-methyltransferase